jgi:sortase A
VRQFDFTDDRQDHLKMRALGWIQRLLLVVGLLLLGIYVGAHIHRTIMSRVEVRRFEDIKAKPDADKADIVLSLSGLKVSFDLWSEKRIEAYEHSLMEHFDPPLAILHIAKVSLEAPVLEGTDDLTLNRGVGHIAGTGRPGQEGNIGIAGHRDGFFRALKDIGPGDTIELVTASRKDVYTVDQIVLVSPSDVSVLEARPGRSLTLVTCYPFYFIGSAPQRYIVQASVRNSDDNGTGSGRGSKLQALSN